MKKIDNLSDWLYARIDYSYSNPTQHLSFLMNTEKQLWRPAKTKSEQEAMLVLFSNQAYNQLFSGNILESIDRYEKAYNYFIENNLNVAGIADYIFKPWANNYTRLGDYEKALFIQKQTLAYALKEKDYELVAGSYNNLAISYKSLGDLRQAEKHVKIGLSKIPSTSPTVILLNNTLADVYKDGSRTKLADSIIKFNIRLQERGRQTFETAYWLMSSYITAGDIQFDNKRYQLAESFYKRALGINDKFYKGERAREKAYIITQMGNIKLQTARPKEAIAYYNKTLNILGIEINSLKEDDLFGDNRLIDVLYQRAIAYKIIGEPVSALRDLTLSLAAADKIRFELADKKTKQRFQADTKRKAEMGIAIAFSLLEKTGHYRYAGSIIALSEQTKARILLDEIRRNKQQLSLRTKDPLVETRHNLERAIAYNERETLLSLNNTSAIKQKTDALLFRLASVNKKLQEKYPAITEPENSSQQSLKRILSTLPRSANVIEYFVGNDCIYMLQIKQRKIVHVNRILSAEKIKSSVKRFVKTYYQNGPEAMMNSPRAFFIASNQLYNSLLGGTDIHKNEKLTVIPDDVLGYLSFDGLIADSTYTTEISAWPYLIKTNTISYGFSLKTLHNQSAIKKNPNNDFTGFFISHEQGSEQAIPAVIKEAGDIKKVINGNYMLDDKATAGNFMSAFGNSSVLHISTHAYLSGEQEEPTLALKNHALFLFELSASRHSPQLVVLSACRTADGLMAAGEGILSLGRGFTALGSQGTIAGLWNVNDDAAANITAACYNEMLKGKDISTALHHAKIKWLSGKRNGEQEFLPYYWDSLIYMGIDQKILLKPPAGKTIIYLLYSIGILATATIILLVLKRSQLRAGWSKK
ncbi:MAG: CHAT domain-containing tetratricopeptide repeat protein [Bacteroidota bacterium]